MLLESIELKNFRQFRNESLDFAKGEDGKNVTIIIGENGTGKTTFAQAFFWCLYGETEFSDKVILNKLLAAEMRPGEEHNVQVILKLRHNEVEYKLIREQVYRKEYPNKLTSANTVFDIEIKNANGNTSYIKKTLCESEATSILPKELSHYFFFDGERIEKMSKDISSSKKATDFADAVKGLLGLNAMITAIKHFNPNSKYGVIGSYENSFDSKSNSKIHEYTKKIEECKEKMVKIDARIEALDLEITSAQERKADKTEEIKSYVEGEKLQTDKEKLQQRIENTKRARSNLYKVICKDFNNRMSSFFSLSLIKRALEILAEENFSGKDIPDMHVKTIEYLLKRKICICGTHLDEGSVSCNKVKELIDYLPPQSVGVTVGQFKRDSRIRCEKDIDLFSSIKENLVTISNQDEELTELTDELHAIEKKLSGGDVQGKVRAINNNIKLCDDIIRKGNQERDSKNIERGRLLNEIERSDTERQNLTLLDDKNKKIEIYKVYAERIHKELLEVYNESEERIRNKLQETINYIFKQIYEGGLYLNIDSKYHISIYATNYEGDVETSTAQSISVIFAFISGIIKMVRENRNASDDDAKLLTSEPYPLVMDAPLSLFDKRRIKSVCMVLPEIAEQVIIFIKDTDGELAEEYMASRIGSRHRFVKKTEFETMLI